MSTVPKQRMTADEFIAWAMEQPETAHYELVAGEIVAMAPDRSAHALAQGRIYRRLVAAVEAAGLECTVYPDRMAVQVDERTVYEPDAQVRCGTPVDQETVKLCDPMIVVEVLSPSTQGVDTGHKLMDYFRVPSVQHYLLVRPSDHRVVHHWRGADSGINTRIHAGGPIRLDPQGITLADLTTEVVDALLPSTLKDASQGLVETIPTAIRADPGGGLNPPYKLQTESQRWGMGKPTSFAAAFVRSGIRTDPLDRAGRVQAGKGHDERTMALPAASLSER